MSRPSDVSIDIGRRDADTQRNYMTNITANRKLEMMAEEFDWPLADLLDFYQIDMTDIEEMKVSEVRFMIQDYITNYTACRDIPNAELFKRSREATQ